jgi:hypothetical protein
VEPVQRGRSRGGQGDLHRAPILRIVLPYYEAALLGAIHQAGQAGSLQAQHVRQLGHADGSVRQRAEHLCLGGGEIAAAADLGVQVLDQERQPHQPAGGSQGLLHGCSPLVLVPTLVIVPACDCSWHEVICSSSRYYVTRTTLS